MCERACASVCSVGVSKQRNRFIYFLFERVISRECSAMFDESVQNGRHHKMANCIIFSQLPNKGLMKGLKSRTLCIYIGSMPNFKSKMAATIKWRMLVVFIFLSFQVMIEKEPFLWCTYLSHGFWSTECWSYDNSCRPSRKPGLLAASRSCKIRPHQNLKITTV